ncbi:pentapeptide repeat-containing protein [Arsenophonus sp. aPb]|uniref:pentapeptide repeat-containing protein n=1 Tax=Arsenophonus sp. aPb TaxID=3041619 RepID=UPI00246920E8|nr:pentapeptide repeat-containing protein [Arsenophonus sp. aPb]WGL97923.1 pentapeptide repeat-containing protein [Arsenophonus sp. aPb]
MKLLFKTLTIFLLLGVSFLSLADANLGSASIAKATLKTISLADANLSSASLAEAKLCEVKLILDPETKLEKYEVISGTCR